MEYVFFLFLTLAVLIPVTLYYVFRYITNRIKINIFLVLPIVSVILWFIAFITFFKLAEPELTLDSVLLILPRTGMNIFVIIPLIIISIIIAVIGLSKHRKLQE
jgi:hypothetical protein